MAWAKLALGAILFSGPIFAAPVQNKTISSTASSSKIASSALSTTIKQSAVATQSQAVPNVPVGARPTEWHPIPSQYGGGRGYAAPAWLPQGQSAKGAVNKGTPNSNHQGGGSGSSSNSAHGASPSGSQPASGSGSSSATTWGQMDSTPQNYDLSELCNDATYSGMPNTGVTRTYNLAVSVQTQAPDGVQKQMLVVNGQFPGPTIEANWGDWIEVTVTNNLATEGTTLHWHGLRQKGTQWADGVPFTSQCPLVPGESLTYQFRADVYGTTWYHSHYSAQYSGGAYGPIVIHGPCYADYDVDLGPVMLSDWFHDPYQNLVEETMDSVTGRPPASNNNLINGKMNYPCENTDQACTPNAGLSKFVFQSGLKYRLRLINSGSDGVQKFSIDGHTLKVIAVDFTVVKAYDVNMLNIAVGQRYDVIVEAVGKPTDLFWMRSSLGLTTFPDACSNTDGISPDALAIVYYSNADMTATPNSQSSITAAQMASCDDLPLGTFEVVCPESSVAPAGTTTQRWDVTIDIVNNGTNFVWEMNKSTFRANYNHALLQAVSQNDLSFLPEWNVYDSGEADYIQIVMYNSIPFTTHPMHLHGHDMLILATGFGQWDGTVNNAANPLRRDTYTLSKAIDFNTPAYTVIQFKTDNPGVWPFHCHFAWHSSGGMDINILEHPQEIMQMTAPASFQQTCQNWNAYTSEGYTPPMLDSGI